MDRFRASFHMSNKQKHKRKLYTIHDLKRELHYLHDVDYEDLDDKELLKAYKVLTNRRRTCKNIGDLYGVAECDNAIREIEAIIKERTSYKYESIDEPYIKEKPWDDPF